LKILIIIILLIVTIGCPIQYDCHYLYETQPINIVSENMFSINGKVFNEIDLYIPFTVYNPNKYDINITIDEIEYIINSHEELTINTP